MAARIGFELHYEDGGQASDHGNRARLLAANAAAETFFRSQLATPEAQVGRDFLGSRGFDQAAAERFGVGFAPKSLRRAQASADRPRLHRAGAHDGGPAQHRRPRQLLRPLPRTADLADPRHHRPDRRVRRPQAARRRPGPEVPQHPRDSRVSQGPGALRARSGPPRHREEQAGRHRRGLHGCHGLPPRGRHDRGRHLRHELRRRPHQDRAARARRRRQCRLLGHGRGGLHLRSG